MTENRSYFITVVVEKHPRKAYFTQEVFISPGDPPVVEIRCDHGICIYISLYIRIYIYIYIYLYTYIYKRE